MNAKDVIRHSLNLARLITTNYLQDLDDSALLVRPVPGMNPIAWQLGHLIMLERKMMEAVRPGRSPELPENFEANHSSSTAQSDDPSVFLSREQYQKLFDAQRNVTLQLLDEVSDEEMDKPSPEGFENLAPTVGLLFSLAADHEIMHSGQFTAVRRKLGKPVTI
jgi:uncharacterized damage-inducible protein DinB